MNIEDTLISLSVIIIPLLLAITLHEAAHGWVADKLGDNTARMLGRVTFNPIKHIDPFGTILLPGIMFFGSMGLSGNPMIFGFAKPVPVNPYNLRSPRRDMILVALAGPVTNLLIAFFAALGFYAAELLPDMPRSWVYWNLGNAVWINCLLFVFNMLPMPPLDGGRVAVGILPRFLALPLAKLERAGIFIVLAFFFVLPWLGQFIGMDLNFLSRFLLTSTAAMADLVGTAAGIR